MSKLKFAAYPVIVLLSLAAAVSAHAAGDITVDDSATQVFAHTKTRAQVQQELLAARADGTANVGADNYNPFARLPRSSQTRDQVQADVRGQRLATVNLLTGEDSGSFHLSQTWTQRDASRVLAGTQR